MTHKLALKLARTETPDQIADRIVELYETINDLRISAARWEHAWQRAVEERDDLRAKLVKARSALTWIAEHPNARFNVAVCHPKDPTIQQKVYATLASIEEE